MTKSIKLSDETYIQLRKIREREIQKQNKSISFDDVVWDLIGNGRKGE